LKIASKKLVCIIYGKKKKEKKEKKEKKIILLNRGREVGR
jgi:hypothetical protein